MNTYNEQNKRRIDDIYRNIQNTDQENNAIVKKIVSDNNKLYGIINENNEKMISQIRGKIEEDKKTLEIVVTYNKNTTQQITKSVGDVQIYANRALEHIKNIFNILSSKITEMGQTN